MKFLNAVLPLYTLPLWEQSRSHMFKIYVMQVCLLEILFLFIDLKKEKSFSGQMVQGSNDR